MTEHFMIGAYAIVSFLDFVMLYYFCKNVTRRKMELFSWRNPISLEVKQMLFKLPMAILGIFYGVMMGVFQYTLEGHTYRMIVTLAFILIIKFLSRYSIADALLAYMMFLFFGVILQGLTVLLMLPLSMHPTLLMLISQLLTALVIVALCYRIQIYRVFNYIKTNILLKLMMTFTTIGVLGFVVFLNFENNPTYIVYFLGLIFLIIFILTPLWMRLYKRLEIDVKRAHFIANKILAAYLTAEITDDIHVIRQELKELLAHVSPETGTIPIVIGDMEETILTFIDKKKKQHQIENDVMAKIEYYSDHKDVKPGTILSFLGLLLDNAFEVETNKPILVDYSSVNHACYLTVSNEYFPKNASELDMMFEKGYSTKAEDGRGYGLYELKHEVETLGGLISCFENYNDVYESHYLTFMIEFKN